jgi:hypothetical protein
MDTAESAMLQVGLASLLHFRAARPKRPFSRSGRKRLWRPNSSRSGNPSVASASRIPAKVMHVNYLLMARRRQRTTSHHIGDRQQEKMRCVQFWF